jgi:hypothetical protein
MTFYLTAERIGELAEYPPSVRRLIVHRAIGLLRGNSRLAGLLPDLLSVCGSLLGVTGALLVGAHTLHPRLEELIPAQMCYDLIGVFIGGLGGGFMGLQLQIQKLRPFMQKALEDFIDETMLRI